MSSSRIIVKNLPKHATEKRLREHFGARGFVTDVKVAKTKDGRTRQFGFIGFKTEGDAEDAVKFFNRSFMDTSKLSVELAFKANDAALPRAWSKYSEGSSANQKKAEKEVKESGDGNGDDAKKAAKKKKSGLGISEEEIAEDPKLKEFLEVVQPRAKGKAWDNDGALPAGEQGRAKGGAGPKGGGDKAAAAKGGHKRFRGGGGSDDGSDTDEELYEDAPAASGSGSDSDSEEDEDEEVVAKRGAEGEGVSDLDYLKSRTKAVFSDDDDEAFAAGGSGGGGRGEGEEDESGEEGEESDDEEESDEEDESGSEGGAGEDEEMEDGAKVAGDGGRGEAEVVDAAGAEDTQPGRLFVRNLPYTAEEDELSEAFGKFGELLGVHIVKARDTKLSKGIAFVHFMIPECADNALQALDGSIFQGRLMHVMPAKGAPEKPEEETGVAGKGGYKDEKDKALKAQAGNAQSWNTLFMRADTVAEGVARQYGVTKGELLDKDAGDLAVRVALGETHMIAETKRKLASEGVNVEALEEAAKAAGRGGKEAKAAKAKVARSPNTILVKNLPFEAEEAELSDLFGRHGALGRVVLPPTKTMALVEFLEAAEARAAFKALAFKRFKHTPLYLEWAPAGIFSAPAPEKKAGDVAKAKPGEDIKNGRSVEAMQAVAEAMGGGDGEDGSEETRTVYVKNLAFGTGDKALEKHFAPAGGRAGALRSAKVSRKAAKNGKELSLGFGFVEYSSPEAARNAVQKLQGSMLDGHKLLLQLSSGRRGGGAAAAGGQKRKEADPATSSTKLIVRNVAFEATRRELQQLFNPFGQVRSLRLPRKFDGNHRGFAFVDFVTRQEALSAHAALSGTHLYGRHMVLEWAKEGEDVEDLRERTAAKYKGDSGGGGGAKRARGH